MYVGDTVIDRMMGLALLLAVELWSHRRRTGGRPPRKDWWVADPEEEGEAGAVGDRGEAWVTERGGADADAAREAGGEEAEGDEASQRKRCCRGQRFGDLRDDGERGERGEWGAVLTRMFQGKGCSERTWLWLTP